VPGSILSEADVSRIAWCDNLVPNVYGTEVYLTCSLNDAQDVIIFQVGNLLMGWKVFLSKCRKTWL
jgi:hypothetical protein